MSKRQREKQRQEAKLRKAEKKAQRNASKDGSEVPEGVDPDIAGIVPGPQPLPDEAAPLDTDVYPITNDEEDERKSS
ncbi:MAG: hypothetical protein AAFZ18_06595 [Myxococcota bacterium]